VATYVGLIVVVAAYIDETLLYGRLAGLYSYPFLILLLMVALAMVVYLQRNRGPGDGVVPTILTAASGVVVVVVLYFVTVNFDLLTGATATAAVVIIYGVAVIGMVMAWVYRSRRPDVYARIGRDDAAALEDPTP